MELHQIKYFLALCDTRNFTRAAEACNVTQPALTRAIKKLEEELGGPLFRRERNLSHLTELGRLMQPYLQSVAEEVEAAKSRATGFSKLEEAPIEIGVMCTIGPARVVSLLARLHREMPGVQLTIQELAVDQLLELLLAGEIDAALLASPTPLPERIDARPLYRERFVIGFPPGHRFESYNAVPVQELQGESYLARTDCEFRGYFNELLAAQNVAMKIRYRSPREEWIQSMILAGMGCAFLPEYLALNPGMPTRPVIEPEVTREVCLATVAGRRHSPPLAAFMRLVGRHNWGVA